MISVSTQTLGDFQNEQTQTDLFEIESHSDTHLKPDIDTSFCFKEDLSTEDKEESNDDNERPNRSTLIVYWSCLPMLQNQCLSCLGLHLSKKLKGYAVCVHLFAKMVMMLSSDHNWLINTILEI